MDYPTSEFLKHFGNIEINDLKRIMLPRELSTESQDIYWLGGVKPGLYVRAKDSDIVSKNYFVVDLDLYSEHKKMGSELGTEELLGVIDMVVEFLDADDLLKEWSFVVFSGRGMHLYYMGTPRAFDKEVYASGVNRIYKLMDAKFGGDPYHPDFACKNIARIMRLPGTVNSKNGERCRILKANPRTSRLFEDIERLAAQEMAEMNAERDKIKAEYAQRNASNARLYGDKGNFYEYVNQNFPASHLAEEIIGFRLASNGRNFINEHGGYTGYWYDKKTNLIMNGGSTHYFLNHAGYNPFMIAKEYFKLTDKETFEYFRKQFNIKD